MAILIARETFADVPRNTTVILQAFAAGSIIRDDDGWYDTGTDFVEVPGGTYRVTASVGSEDSDMTAAQRFYIAHQYDQLSPVLTVVRNADDGACGSTRPWRTTTGLLTPASTSIVGIRFLYGDGTADRDFVVELQIESV